MQFTCLSEDLQSKFFSYLLEPGKAHSKNLFRASLVCKNWHRIIMQTWDLPINNSVCLELELENCFHKPPKVFKTIAAEYFKKGKQLSAAQLKHLLNVFSSQKILDFTLNDEEILENLFNLYIQSNRISKLEDSAISIFENEGFLVRYIETFNQQLFQQNRSLKYRCIFFIIIRMNSYIDKLDVLPRELKEQVFALI